MKKLFGLLFAVVLTMNAYSQGKDVVDIAIGSADHTTLVAAVKAADLKGSNGVVHVIDGVLLPK